MTIRQFKKLLNIIKKDIGCPFCNHSYETGRIHLLAAMPADFTFFTDCSSCQAPIFIHISFGRKHNMEDASIRIQPINREISANEVLDMHNFLKSFQGDLKDYLKVNQSIK